VTDVSQAPLSTDTLQRMADWMTSPHTNTGDLATLRRMDPNDPSSAALVLHRLLGSTGVDGNPSQKWALIAHCLALAHGKHRTGGPNVGQALAALSYGEARLQMLLRADNDTLADILPRLARRLHSKGQPMDWWPLARIVLFSTSHPDRAQRAREQIARDYVVASKNSD
jgi:CRISPR type I-E-associated protein CasB/Cse2